MEDYKNIKLRLPTMDEVKFLCGTDNTTYIYGIDCTSFAHSMLSEHNSQWWTSSVSENGLVHVFSGYGGWGLATKQCKTIGVVPVIEYSSVADKLEKKSLSDEERVAYGEYINYRAYDQERKLEKLYEKGKLATTGKKYSFKFLDRTYTEFIYDGKKYVRFEENSEFAWYRVDSIIWKAYLKYNLLIPECIVVAGVPFDKVNEFLEDFAKDIVPSDPNKVFENDQDQVFVTDEDVFKNQESTYARVPELIITGVTNKKKGFFESRKEKRHFNAAMARSNNALMNALYSSIIELRRGEIRTKLEENFNWLYGYYNREYYRINSNKPGEEEGLFSTKVNFIMQTLKDFDKNQTNIDDQMRELKENVQKRI